MAFASKYGCILLNSGILPPYAVVFSSIDGGNRFDFFNILKLISFNSEHLLLFFRESFIVLQNKNRNFIKSGRSFTILLNGAFNTGMEDTCFTLHPEYIGYYCYFSKAVYQYLEKDKCKFNPKSPAD